MYLRNFTHLQNRGLQQKTKQFSTSSFAFWYRLSNSFPVSHIIVMPVSSVKDDEASNWFFGNMIGQNSLNCSYFLQHARRFFSYVQIYFVVRFILGAVIDVHLGIPSVDLDFGPLSSAVHHYIQRRTSILESYISVFRCAVLFWCTVLCYHAKIKKFVKLIFFYKFKRYLYLFVLWWRTAHGGILPLPQPQLSCGMV